MAHPHYIRHVKTRSVTLRALLHEAWIRGNESNNIHEEPEGETERRKDVLELMLREGFAEMRD